MRSAGLEGLKDVNKFLECQVASTAVLNGICQGIFKDPSEIVTEEGGGSKSTAKADGYLPCSGTIIRITTV